MFYCKYDKPFISVSKKSILFYFNSNIKQLWTLYLVKHDRLNAVAQHLSKFSRDHRLATTLQNPKCSQSISETIPSVLFVCTLHSMVVTLDPIKHMSFTMCDCIISASSCEWLGVLMKVELLLGGHSSLLPAGTWNLIKKKKNMAWKNTKRIHLSD